MKTLRYIVLALLFLILVAVVVGFFLPAKVHLERSINIKRDKATIFNVINSLENFNKWSPWFDLDKEAKYTLSGAKSGVGSKLEWIGNDAVGEGSQEIIESVENDHIKTKMFFGKSEAPAYSIISVQENGESTKVTWAFENDFGMNIFYRYFGLVIEDMIAPDYEKGLKKLKSHAESLPLFDYSNISIVNTKAVPIYTYQSHSGKEKGEVSQAIKEAYGKVIQFITAKSIQMAGTPKLITLKFSESKFDFIAAIPVVKNDIEDETGEVIAKQSYQGKAIKMIHIGSYENFQQSYEILMAYMQQNKIEQNGYSWEDYVSDPGEVAQKDLITHIYMPIK